jgi:cytoskeletal protein CcmA (bactofilin family)
MESHWAVANVGVGSHIRSRDFSSRIRLETHPVCRVRPANLTYYTSQVTVLSGLLCNFSSLAATEFSVGGKIMWRKPEDSKPAAPAAEIPAPAAAPRVEPAVRSVAGLTAEVVQPSGGIITSTLLIKGEVRGSDDLYVDGEVQGTIHLTNGRVTVGPHGKISADVDAREIIVRGKVTGALRGRERVEIGSTGEVRGDIATSRIAIGEGAQIHSKVEIARVENSQNNRTLAKPSGGASAASQVVAMKAGGENGN